MINPLDYGAAEIGQLPMVLTHVHTLESFDGPLLVEFRSETGDTFLYSWCDRDADVDRWIVLRTPIADLARYLVRATTLQELIVKCHDGFVYLLDLDRNDEVRGTFYMKADPLPGEYLPAEQSHYEATIATTGQNQDVFVNDERGYQHATEYERKYLHAYDFVALFGQHGNSLELPKIDYQLTTGYVYHTLFEQFRAHVPYNMHASVAELNIASPGYVRFRVNPVIASDLLRTVEHFTANREVIDATTYSLGRWLAGRDSMPEDQARKILTSLCDQLNIKSAELLECMASTEMASKALRSYVNRLTYLADQQREQTAMMVGLKLPLKDSSETA